MEPVPSNKRDLYRIYLATLFFAVHYVLVVYINSTYLSGILGPASKNFIGLLYVAGSIISISILSYSPHILRRIGNKAFMLILVVIEVFALMTMAFAHSVPIVLGAFITHDTIIPILYFSFDIFVQHFSRHENAGKARGTFLSIVNFCFVFVPLVGGIILAHFGFSGIYFTAPIILIPLLYFVATVRDFKDSDYLDQNIFGALKTMRKSDDVTRIVATNLILQMFYAVMVIYMPIYLYDTLGFSVGNVGLIFTVMLTPFVIFELPLGKISDAFLGEKEILIAGLLIMGISTASLPLITSHALIVWACILFLTRVGASWTEIMTESYFFKKIDDKDAELVSVWGALNSFAYIVIPLIMSTLLFFTDIRYVFPVMGAIVLCGIFFAARIKDTL